MSISEIIKICDGELLCGNLDYVVKSFSKDTRTISQNDTYVGIKGEKFDGNDYLISAFDKGVTSAIVDKKIDVSNFKNKNIIYVKDSVVALGKLAKYKRDNFKGEVIAITGSVGKTTTKDLIVKVLCKKYKLLYTIGNSNNHIGMPLTILNGDDADIWVLEMGMNNLGEISYLSNIAKPTLSVITNVGTAHIGNLGSRENILKAKLEILDGMINKKVIINNDNDLLHSYSLNNDCITVGIKNNSMYKASVNKDIYFNDIKMKLFSNEEPFILNSLLAFACGDILGVNKNDIKNALNEFVLLGNRLNTFVSSKGYTIINDSYNASYDSIKLSLDVLCKYNCKKVFVFADMLELGEYSRELHVDVGKLVCNSLVDCFVCIGFESKYAFDFVNEKKECYYFVNNEEASNFLEKYLNVNDVILFKGSNGMKLNQVVDRLK